MSTDSSLHKLWILATEYRSAAFLLITVIGGCLCFLPMANDSNLEDTVLGNALRHGPMTRIAVAASISLAVPVFMNLFADIYVDSFTTTKSTSSNSKDILTKTEKFIFMLGVIIPPIVYCFSGWNKATLLYGCATCLQQQFVFGIMITSLNRFNDNYFPTSITCLMGLIITAGSIVRPYGMNSCPAVSYMECLKSPTILNTYVSISGTGILFCLILFWFSSVLVGRLWGEKVKSYYYRWPTWCCLHDPLPTIKSRNISENNMSSGPVDDGLLYFRVTYCLTIVTWILLWVAARNLQVFYLWDDNSLMKNIVAPIVFQLSVLFFDTRFVKHEAVSALVALLEAKKSYVRYISHELRTPLSAANSGLQMLQEELSASAVTNAIDEERLDTLNDVCTAISTTVDILNDLLTFEKMER